MTEDERFERNRIKRDIEILAAHDNGYVELATALWEKEQTDA
jgi:hypothetical protein